MWSAFKCHKQNYERNNTLKHVKKKIHLYLFCLCLNTRGNWACSILHVSSVSKRILSGFKHVNHFPRQTKDPRVYFIFFYLRENKVYVLAHKYRHDYVITLILHSASCCAFPCIDHNPHKGHVPIHGSPPKCWTGKKFLSDYKTSHVFFLKFSVKTSEL